MCQLFAINSVEPVEASSLLREFFTHADSNPHGWGVADLSFREAHITRSAERADQSPDAEHFLARPRHYTNVLAHIRAATVGQVELDNCHPFTAVDASGRHWTLIHKGTIFDFEPLNPYFHQQVGTTDSERILLYLIDLLNAAIVEKGAPLESDERFEVFSRLVRDMSAGNCLNLIIFDSDQFFVHSNYQGGLRLLSSEGRMLLCTSPLEGALAVAEEAPGAVTAATTPQPAWQPLPLCTPLAFKHGRLVLSGVSHEHEYFDNEKDVRYLYQDYAGL
ncbi:MAG: class II glutamine amidotransferase, partial [Coriobacteriales bacterium]|jgi:glutamine amidotransferase|nr:class II glutamine amidotransferase [Coriobacteriales bacterium]